MSHAISIFGISSTLYKNSLFVPFFKVDDIKSLEENYEPEDNDIFIVTYPKCGTTWLIHICYQMMRCYHQQQMSNTGCSEHTYYSTKHEYNSNETLYQPQYINLRSTSSEQFEQYIKLTQNTLRFWKIHAPKTIFPINKPFAKWNHKKYKIIIIARNPKDACISYYFHQKNVKKDFYKTVFNGDFNLFFVLWISGLIRNTNYFSWHKEWFDVFRDKTNKLSTKIHWMYYEDLNCNNLKDKIYQIQKLVKFLDLKMDYFNQEIIEIILNKTSFNRMKKEYDAKTNYPIKHFIRKGIVGDWKNYLNHTQSQIIDHLVTINFHHAPSFKYYQDLMHKKKYFVSKL